MKNLFETLGSAISPYAPTEKTPVTFKSPKEMINWLMDNPGKVLKDGYGRQWLYEDFSFSFKDIGESDFAINRLSCLHLYGTINA